jgi:hypothetical protein
MYLESRVRQLEQDNHLLQAQYMKMTEKFVNLTEEYVKVTLKLQEKEVSR